MPMSNRVRSLIAVAIGLTLAPSTYADCPESSPYEHWEDLLNFTPDENDYTTESDRFNNPGFEFQPLDGDYGDNVNFDDFSVRVDRIPSRFASPEAFFDHIRRSFNSFVNTDITTLRGMTRESTTAWSRSGPAPTGSMHVFDIHGAGPGVIHEQAPVLVTRSSPTSWTFSTITVDAFNAGRASGFGPPGVRNPTGARRWIRSIRASSRSSDRRFP